MHRRLLFLSLVLLFSFPALSGNQVRNCALLHQQSWQTFLDSKLRVLSTPEVEFFAINRAPSVWSRMGQIFDRIVEAGVLADSEAQARTAQDARQTHPRMIHGLLNEPGSQAYGYFDVERWALSIHPKFSDGQISNFKFALVSSPEIDHSTKTSKVVNSKPRFPLILVFRNDLHAWGHEIPQVTNAEVVIHLQKTLDKLVNSGSARIILSSVSRTISPQNLSMDGYGILALAGIEDTEKYVEVMLHLYREFSLWIRQKPNLFDDLQTLQRRAAERNSAETNNRSWVH